MYGNSVEAFTRIQSIPKAGPAPEPEAPSTTAGGLWRAVRNAVPAAVAESAAMVAKGASIAFDDSPDNRGPVRQFGEEVERSLRNVAESYGPDPMTASKAEQVVFGLTRGVGKAVGYGLTTGPAAPFLFGADEGLTEREKLLRQGVDEATATKVGALAGAVNVAGFAIPAAGATVAKTIGLATLSGPASFVAQQAGSREILRNADYESIASSYDPTDALGLGLSAIPFGFGALAMRGRFKTGKPAPEAKPAVANESLTTQPAPDAIPIEPMRAADETGAVIHAADAPTVPKVSDASSGIYTLSDAISADGPTNETVKLIVREDGSAAIQRENGDVIDVTNMIRAGFSAERAIAQSLGDDTSGVNVTKTAAPSPRSDAIPVEPVRAADELGVSPDIAQATPDVVARSPDVVARADHIVDANKMVEPVLTQEHVDAAMVKNLMDASEFMRVMESPPMESLEAFAARTIPPEAPAPKAGKDPFLAWLRKHGGVNIQDKFDITGEANVIRLNRGAVFKKQGRGVDELAQIAESEGWLPPGAAADIDGGVPQLKEMIRRAMGGESIKPLETIYGDIEAQHRMDADAMMAEELSRRLEVLGVDPTPARGNVDVLSAYLEQHEPRLIRQRLAEVGTLDEYDLPAPTPKETPADVPTPEKLGTETREAPAPEGKAEVGKGAEGAADAATVAVYKSEAERILETNPDMVVDVDAQGNKVTAREALEKIRREAAEGTATELGADDAKLVKVAAECALSFGE